MAFTPANAVQNNAAGNNEKWKNDYFINLSLPNGNGKAVKIGAIGLKLSDVRHKKLIEWLNADPALVQEKLHTILGKLIADYREAKPNEDDAFDLS